MLVSEANSREELDQALYQLALKISRRFDTPECERRVELFNNLLMLNGHGKMEPLGEL